MIEELAGQLADPKVLVIGLGEIGTDVVRNFSKYLYSKNLFDEPHFSKSRRFSKRTWLSVCSY